MNEKGLIELKDNFKRCVFKYSRSDKDRNDRIFENVWDRLEKLHKDRPYHNLSLAYNDLNTARNLKVKIPDHIIVAAVLRYGNFNPYIDHNALESCGWSAMFLRHAFEWPDNEIEIVKKIILASSRLGEFADDAPLEEKLVHDMKMSRFAKNVVDFHEDRQKIRLEFQNASDDTFYCNEQAVLMNYYHARKIFLCKPFQTLRDQAQDNMYKRLAWVSELLKRKRNSASQKACGVKILEKSI